jgi:hypothetical protein
MKIELKDHVVSSIQMAVTQLVTEKEKQPKPEKTGKKGKVAGQYVTTKDVIKALELEDNVFSVMCVNQIIKTMPGYKSVKGCGILRG